MMVFSVLLLINRCRHLVFRLISGIFQCLDDGLFMFVAKGFHRDGKFYCSISVDADKLVMLQTNDISLCFGNHFGDMKQFTRKLNGYGKDTSALDQSVLNNRGHCNDIHISTTQDGNDFFATDI